MTPNTEDTAQARRHWLSVLARAETAELESMWDAKSWPVPQLVRVPESGMVMLRARVAGNGAPFNLGEASVTRCAVRLGDGPLGIGYTLGRAPRKAELIACFDAALQQSEHRATLSRTVIAPLERNQAQARAARSAAAASSKVEFYTLVRGEA